jgi:uncharacterized coiled-coil protein SlyX
MAPFTTTRTLVLGLARPGKEPKMSHTTIDAPIKPQDPQDRFVEFRSLGNRVEALNAERLEVFKAIERLQLTMRAMHERIQALEAGVAELYDFKIVLNDREIKRRSLESRIAALEDAHPEDLKDVSQGVTNLFVALANQRALTKELWEWFQDDSSDPISEALAKAFEDALK